MRFLTVVIIIINTLILGCSENPSEPDELLGTITGIVTNSESNETLPGARVTTSPSTSSKVTDASGSYTIPDIEPGTYVVSVEKEGYTTKSASVNVEADRTVSADLQLPEIQPT
jgi:TolB protein